MFDEIRHNRKIRKLQLELDDNIRKYNEDINKAPSGKEGWQRKQMLNSEYSFEYDEILDLINIQQTEYISKRARYYFIPLPDSRGDCWENSKVSGRKVLTQDAQGDLRRLIRIEEREQFDHWARWVTLGVGLIGALIGLISTIGTL